MFQRNKLSMLPCILYNPFKLNPHLLAKRSKKTATEENDTKETLKQGKRRHQ